jgi:hypothetical protein
MFDVPSTDWFADLLVYFQIAILGTYEINVGLNRHLIIFIQPNSDESI